MSDYTRARRRPGYNPPVLGGGPGLSPLHTPEGVRAIVSTACGTVTHTTDPFPTKEEAYAAATAWVAEARARYEADRTARRERMGQVVREWDRREGAA